MPRLSSPSFKVVIKGKALSDGTYPIRIQSNWHGQSEVGLGISLPSLSDFDKARQRVRKTVPNHQLINQTIEQRLLVVRQDYLSKVASGVTDFTAKGLLDCLRSESVPVDNSLVSSCFDHVMNGKCFGTSNFYKVTKNHVIRCYGDVPMRTITDGEKFMSYLRGRGLKESTMRTVATLFGAVWADAVERHLIPYDVEFPIKKSVIKRLSRNSSLLFLNEYQLELLYEHYLMSVLELRNAGDIIVANEVMKKMNSTLRSHHDLEFKLSYEEIIKRGSMTWAEAIFGCMVFCGGASPIDLGKMKLGEGFKEVIIGGKRYWKVSGLRSKTNKPFNRNIPVNALTSAFLLPFINTAASRGGYVFNVMRLGSDDDKDLSDNRNQRIRMDAFSNLINPKLKELWDVLNEKIKHENSLRHSKKGLIDTGCTIYSARHCFGTVHLSRSGNIHALCSEMGRSASGITTYIHQLTDDEKLAEDSEKLGF